MSAPSPAAPPARDRSATRRRSIVRVAAAAVFLAGAAAATAVFLLLDPDHQPQRQHSAPIFLQDRHDVSVFLELDATAGQRETVASALTALDPVGRIRFESHEEAWADFQELFKDSPELIANTKMEQMPESFRLTTAGEEFDCAALASVRQLPGVDEVVVLPAAC